MALRSGQLFFKYPNKREGARNLFFSELQKLFAKTLSAGLQQSLTDVVTTVRRVEEGYRNVLHILNKLPARSRPPTTQVSAALKLASHYLDFVERRARESIKKKKRLSVPDEPTGTLDDGTPFLIDSATTSLIENLGATLEMFAHENGWISRDGRIVFPELQEVSDEELSESVAVATLATSWIRWERVEQRRRYWGGEFVEIENGRAIEGMPGEARAYFEYVPSGEEHYDWIANERLKEQLQQIVAELMFETPALEQEKDISDQPKLLPDEFVSVREVSSAMYLSRVLGADVRTDRGKYAGLKIIEWLRGYSALNKLALECFERNVDPLERCLPAFDRMELQHRLEQAGLSSEAATAFIAQVTFCTRSEDLFDCPLLQMSGGSLLFVAPAAIHADPGMTTYSNLLSLEERFDGKGKRFEAEVQQFFQAMGLNAFSIDTSRDGEPYEIDVLVPWESHLFIFECKNRGLSNHHPIQSYYFRKERDAFIKQIKRQLNGLAMYPEMAIEAGGVDPRQMQIVPIILYEAPYAEGGAHDGIYIADWSSIGRFFKDRYLNSKTPHVLHRKKRLIHRSGLYSFWQGKEPAPNDLMRQLSDPVQVRIMQSRIKEIESVFVIDENRLGVSRELQRGPFILERVGKLLGFDAAGVKSEERKARRQVAALNKALEQKELRQQTRAFRERQKRAEK